MKKTNFLTKLKKEGKLELVSPSDEIKRAYMNKSESNITSAKILLKNNKFEESVSLAYYSMYHLLTALLFQAGIKSENHTASIIILGEIFDIDNKEIYGAKKERIDKQYYVGFSVTKEEVEETIMKAELFNKKISDFISKMNNEDVKRCRSKFSNLF